MNYFKKYSNCVLVFIKDSNLRSVSQTLKVYKNKGLKKKVNDKLIRNYGIGKILIEKCIEFAKNAGYEFCYIETMHNMKVAQNLYKKYNFKKIHQPLGITGHTSCPVWMLKKL